MNKYSTLRLLMLETGLAKINLNITKPDAWYCNYNEPYKILAIILLFITMFNIKHNN